MDDLGVLPFLETPYGNQRKIHDLNRCINEEKTHMTLLESDMVSGYSSNQWLCTVVITPRDADGRLHKQTMRNKELQNHQAFPWSKYGVIPSFGVNIPR